MRIAFHFPRLASGGVEKMRIVLAKELTSRGFDVDFVLCKAEGEYLDQVPETVRIIDLGAPRTRQSLIPLIGYLNSVSPEYLISSLGPQNIVSVLAKRLSRARTRVFVTQHNALTLQSKTKSTIQQRLVPIGYRGALRLADGVIAVSHGIAADMSRATGFPLEKVEVIHNPAYIDFESIQPGQLEGLALERPFILSIGRLVHQKGFDDLLRAFAEVHAKRPELNLLILGNGPLEADLRALAHELNISNHVHLIGFRPNPIDYMKRASLFVMSSRHEGFGNVLVEALSAGVPVVSTNCDYGPSEILEQGRYGTLVPVGDVSSLALAIETSLEIPPDRIALQRRAKMFSPASIADHYLTVLGIKK